MVAPHPWGLCDMLGNVEEWCDNLHIKDENWRMLRGGSWSADASICRAAFRYSDSPNHRDNHCGFRVFLVLD